MTSSPEGRQEAAVLDATALRAATDAVTAEINRYWKDDSVEPGHGPVAEAAIRAYLSALPAKPAVEVVEALRKSLERLLLEFDFMIEDGSLPDIRNDIIFVNARAALQAPATPDAQTEVKK